MRRKFYPGAEGPTKDKFSCQVDYLKETDLESLVALIKKKYPDRNSVYLLPRVDYSLNGENYLHETLQENILPADSTIIELRQNGNPVRNFVQCNKIDLIQDRDTGRKFLKYHVRKVKKGRVRINYTGIAQVAAQMIRNESNTHGILHTWHREEQAEQTTFYTNPVLENVQITSTDQMPQVVAPAVSSQPTLANPPAQTKPFYKKSIFTVPTLSFAGLGLLYSVRAKFPIIDSLFAPLSNIKIPSFAGIKMPSFSKIGRAHV